MPLPLVLDLPPSLQLHQSEVFKKRIWQSNCTPTGSDEEASTETNNCSNEVNSFEETTLTPSPGRKKGEEKEKSVGELPTPNESIIKLLNGMSTESEKTQVEQHFRTEDDISKTYDVLRITLPGKEPDAIFSPAQLAVMFKSKPLIKILTDKMLAQQEFARKVLLSKVEVDKPLTEDEPKELSDEACSISILHLAVKYNNEVLDDFLKIAKKHGLQKIVMEVQDLRGNNILQFASFNKSPECIR